jgi:quercetin dioxygenase-like cupin family protein
MEHGHFVKPIDHAQSQAEKPYKLTFFQTDRVLVGLNSFLQGQNQPLHDHPDQDKFYFVLSGSGLFTVGEITRSCGPGEMVLAPAGVPHGVRNDNEALLSFLTVIAPFPGA